jgi:putative transposase
MVSIKKICYKEYPHNPPHLFLPNLKYFITASTYKRNSYFSHTKAKEILLESIVKGFGQENWIIEDWVILDNHYHIMAQASDHAYRLPKIIKEIHRFSALRLKRYFERLNSVKIVWYNYWDTCITYENSYFARLNYIWNNPVKHGYVKNPIEWKFGSYYHRFKNESEYLTQIRKKYPSDRINIDDNY